MRREDFITQERRRRSPGSPSWFDADSNRECDHDTDEHPPKQVASYIGYSDFGYFKHRCGHPDCDETWCTWIEG